MPISQKLSVNSTLLDDLNPIQQQACQATEGPILILAGAGSGKCVVGDTMIFTDKGILRIDQIPNYYIDDGNNRCHARVVSYSLNGSYSKRSTSHWFNFKQSKTIQITTKSGYRLIGTPEHPILILDRSGKLRYKKLIELGSDEVIAISLKNDLWGNHELDPDIAYFMGLFIGDGYLALKGGVGLAQVEESIIEAFKRIAAEKFDINPSKIKSISRYTINDHRKSITHYIYSVRLKKRLEELGLKMVGSMDKSIPQSVLLSPKESVKAFLQGVFDTDGSANGATVELTSSSEVLARQIHICLLNFGIRSSLKPKYVNSYKNRIYWRLSIMGSSLRVFAKKIGFQNHPAKSARLQVMANKISNSNVEIIPFQKENFTYFKNRYLLDSGIYDGHSYYIFPNTAQKIYVRDYLRARRDPSPQQLNRIIGTAYLGGDNCIENMLNLSANFFFDHIDNIKINTEKIPVYDFTVPQTHSFVGNGFINHNTRVLTYKVAYLISEKKILPENILVLTFTNKAAGEMIERIKKLLRTTNYELPAIPVMGTFHSFCAKILRKEGKVLGLPPGFAIYDEGDALDAIKEAMTNLNIPTQKTSPSAVRTTISGAKNELISSLEYPQYARGFFQEIVAKIYIEYQKILQSNHALDFDDLLLFVIKLFQTDPSILTRYQIQFQYILIDEYQDTNPAQYLISKYLANRHKNICVVGDASQCLHPDTKITTNNGIKFIKDTRIGDLVIAAAGRGKTHTVPIQKLKVSDYNGKLFVIKTGSGKILKLTPNHILFSRLSLNTRNYYVYLMYRRDKGYRIGLAKGTRITHKDRGSVIGLQVRSNQESADKMWILKVCKDRAEANFWEQYFVVEYGIPSMVFSTGGRSMLITQKQIDQLYQNINTKERVKRLFDDLNLFEEYPHHRPKGVASRLAPDRQIVYFTLFSDKRPSLRSPWSGHRVSINTSNRMLEEELKALGHYTRAGNRNTWRIETSHWSYEAALNLAEKIANDGGGLTINHSAFIVDNKKFLFTPASHIRETMEVGILDKDQIILDEVISVKTEDYQGKVYDLDVQTLHNYCANGVIVHNSIYSFRGADFRNIVNFEKDYPGVKVFNLEQNYRSTQNILDAAHGVISKNKSHPVLKLWTEQDGGEKIAVYEARNEVEEALFIIAHLRGEKMQLHLGGVAILYRTNAQSRSLEEQFLKAGVPYRLVGGVSFYQRKEIKDVLSYLRLLQNPKDSVSLKRAEKIGKGKLRKLMELFTEVSNNFNEYPTLELLDKILQKTDYLAYLDDGTEEGKGRVENVKELRSVAEEFPNLTEFLENVALVEATDNRRKEPTDAVTLMTLHSAKGLEFSTVFMVGMEEGLFPHSRCLLDPNELEEERRLCYVGITRAKEKLYLTYTRQRLYFGTRSNNLVSRFLSDIPENLITSNSNLKDQYRDADDWLNA